MKPRTDWVLRAYGDDYFEYLSPSVEDEETSDMVRVVVELAGVQPGGPAPVVTYIRIYTLAELAVMLNRAGFEIAEVKGDYKGMPYDAMTSQRLIVAAVRTSGTSAC